MFYSHTLLARKTPLGTVWCAAHLQHRLNKKDYEKTKISIVVDAIMFGEVPLALRTTSFLLLGVVRIYSKQVDYLKHDFDVLVTRINSHSSSKLTLPENACQAPFHSITLPDTFDLDALDLDLDNNIFHEGVQDDHLKSQEEITLAGQIFVGRDAYVAISFDEDVMMDDISHPEEVPDVGFKSMEEDTLSPTMDSTVNLQPGPSISDNVLNMRHNEDNIPQRFPGVEVPRTMDDQGFGTSDLSGDKDDYSPRNVPEIEVLREAVPDFSPTDLPTVHPQGDSDSREARQLIDENIIHRNLSPIMEDKTTLPRTPLPFNLGAGPQASATSHEALEMIDTHISIGPSPTELVLRPTPPQQPKARLRKRKQFFDKSTVLTNKFMKKALEDSSDLLRERNNIPSSSLNVWKLNNSSRKEKFFYHPSVTGVCHDLCDIFNEDYIITKCRSTSMEEASQDPVDVRNIASRSETFSDDAVAPSIAVETAPPPKAAPAPAPDSRVPHTVDPASTSNLEMEIEHLRHFEGNDGDNFMGDVGASPPRFMPSPRYSEGLGSPSEVATTIGPLSSSDQFTTGPSKSVFETPGRFSEQPGTEFTTLSDIPELVKTTNEEELYFLEADDTPAGTRGAQGVDSLTVRTRAVGRYLRSLSPIKSISGGSTQDLSLNNIVEGKRRKQCARMFYEILVLKSHGLIDVQQDEPYGDISLKLTPNLSKAQI